MISGELNEIDNPQFQPLISVIIPCYNHGKYLQQAIKSVLAQQNKSLEIIVIDDGSIDNTKEVAAAFPNVRYVYQQNQGLSAARNNGIDISKGALLVFLDADDWLLKDALSVNAAYLLHDTALAFVSGAHTKVDERRDLIEEKIVVIEDDHYNHFLKGNYIGMHATVMYRRWVFKGFRFDTGLPALEDYDMYLNVARNHKVVHHQFLIAAYRIHEQNMSGDNTLMLNEALKVLGRQFSLLRNNAELKSYKQGIKYWKNYYGGFIYRQLAGQPWSIIKNRKKDLNALYAFDFYLYLKLLIKKIINVS